jgi:predicted transcriptional regulator
MRAGAEVRNPVLALPSMRRLQSLSPEVRVLLRAVLREMASDARERAEKCWRTHKAPMAVYWKAVAVYAGHIARALGDR